MNWEAIPDPVPQKAEVLIKVMAAGVNPVETYIRSGNYPRKPVLPYTPGTDAAGIVVAIGPEVNRFKVGDRIYTSGSITGTYAEMSLCDEKQVHPLSDRLTFNQGAALGIPYATAYRALFQKARAVPGEWVLVHGASGGVGIATIQWARQAGLRVVGTAGSIPGLECIQQQGAHVALNHHNPRLKDEILEITGSNGLDIIIEMLANVNLGKDLTLLARGGRVVVVGSRGPVEITPRDLMSRDAQILGMTLFNATDEELFQIHSAIQAGINLGTLSPLIAYEIPMSRAPHAHEMVMEPGAKGKIVLIA
jgi:NADPH2:quinone reductase